MNNHWYNEGKEYLRKDDKFDHQGKSEEQYKGSAIGALIGFLGVALTIIVIKLLNL